MTTFDTDDPRNIWVSANAGGDGTGTHESPFPELSSALKKAAPGRCIILMPGIYPGDQTVEVSGDENNPFYITAQTPGESIVDNGCWYFYDTSDLVVSGLTFKNARYGAVSVIGQCLRNRFHNINFAGCGANGEASCTFYFGGAGARFNLVEDCVFARVGGGEKNGREDGGQPEIAAPAGINKQNITVGLMISDGGDGAPLLNHAVKNNRFSGYDRAIIIGSGGAEKFESGHTVDLNKISGCAFDGIVVKCADVQVRGNEINRCAGAGIVLDGGEGSAVEGNLISGCGGGISITGTGHSVAGNHIT